MGRTPRWAGRAKFKTLFVVDFDGTLYRSPGGDEAPPAWWYSERSLSGWGRPGFDSRWILPVLQQARSVQDRPDTFMVLMTGRPSHQGMERVIGEMIHAALLRPKVIRLKPVVPPAPTPLYKANEVRKWILSLPRVNRVVFYDDLEENHVAVGAMVRRMGKEFVGLYPPA